MKIRVHSLVFHPDHSGIARYATDFALFATEQGHEVEVVTGYSFYPKWEKREEDMGKLFSIEHWKGMKILRGYIYVPKNPSTVKRLLQEFTFFCSSAINYLRSSKPELVVVFTTPISVGFLASLAKSFNKAKLVINVQDFQLEAAAALGMVKFNFFFNILARAEKYSFKKANFVSSISNSMCELLIQKKQLSAKKVINWPNWIDENEIKLDKSKKGVFRQKHAIASESFVIAYAGNVGLKQGLEIFADLAKRFEKKPNFVFLLIGEGAGLQLIREHMKLHDITNLAILPFLNHHEYIEFLNDIDLFFMSQKKTEFDVYFPSKLLGIMAAKKSLLLSADQDSELYKTVKVEEIGFATTYDDIEQLVYYVNMIYSDNEVTQHIQENAIKYVSTYYRNTVLNKFFDDTMIK